MEPRLKLLESIQKRLENSLQDEASSSINKHFEREHKRANEMSFQAAGLYVDFSKQRVSQQAMNAMVASVEDLPNFRDELYQGRGFNQSEKQRVLFPALRGSLDKTVTDGSKYLFQIIQAEQEKALQLALELRNSEQIDHLIVIGIGGSTLGVNLCYEALNANQSSIKLVCLSTLDELKVRQLLASVNPKRAKFIIQSKSFSTSEVFHIYGLLTKYLAEQGMEEQSVKEQTYAVTANTEKALAFGIEPSKILQIWGWTSGRFSLWSSIGWPLQVCLGPEVFEQLLQGAACMDEHYFKQPVSSNLPLIAAMVDFWNHQILLNEHRAIFPYSGLLDQFVDYLSQLEAESLGKSLCENGQQELLRTGQWVWGQPGTQYQHAVGQMLHQGTGQVQVELLGILEPQNIELNYHLIAQSMSLLQGNAQIVASNDPSFVPGDVPSTTILLDKLNPFTLGSLLAFYELKVYSHSKLLGLNGFDQWGVELAKTLAQSLKAKNNDSIDPSSLKLLEKLGKSS